MQLLPAGLRACLYNLLNAFILVSFLNFISFSTCFNNAHLLAHLTVTNTYPAHLTATLFFPLTIQRNHSTTINESKQINKPVSVQIKNYFQSKTSKKTNEPKKPPQETFQKTGINSSSVTAHSSDQLKNKFKYPCHLPQLQCVSKMQEAVQIF